MNNTKKNTTRKNKKNKDIFNLYNLYTSIDNVNNYIMNYGSNYNEKNHNLLQKLKEDARKEEEKYFYIRTKNNYTFRTIEQFGKDVIELKFFMTDHNNANDICVKISVPRNKRYRTGNIDVLYYNKECSISKIKLKEKEGTIEMLKTALQYIYDTYPYITKLTIQDETHYNDSLQNKPHITAKRLLLGRPGWYQEYFGAEPEKKTLELINHIATKRSEIDNTISKIKPNKSGDEWWSTENILNIINNLQKSILRKRIYNIAEKIFGTIWFIPRNTIEKYNMHYSVLTVESFDVSTNYYKNYVNIHERK